MQRQLDGAWIGPGGPVNTRVSAVLVVSSLIPWSVRAYTPEVYHNPWAKYPLKALSELSTAQVVNGRIKKTQGLSAVEIFELAPNWPA